MQGSDYGEGAIGSASASGKVILLGEHAVVYGEPALAVPVTAVKAIAEVWPADQESSLTANFPDEERRAPVMASLESLRSPDGLRSALESPPESPSMRIDAAALQDQYSKSDDRPGSHGELGVRGSCPPVAEDARAILAVIAAALTGASLDRLPEWSLRIRSQVPTGRGMGSSAAVAVATARAIRTAAGLGRNHLVEADAALQGERVTHGTPSGIDTSVISLERPIRFSRRDGAAPLVIARSFQLVVADSGTPGRTRDMVAGVRERREHQSAVYDRWMARIGELSVGAVEALTVGDLAAIGNMMDECQSILDSLGVSTPEIDRLVEVSRSAGALGAKLSGAGGGGVVISVAASESEGRRIVEAVRRAGAPRVYLSSIGHTEHNP